MSSTDVSKSPNAKVNTSISIKLITSELTILALSLT